MAWGNVEMDWALAKPRLEPPNELPLTLQKVKEMRENQEYFSREKNHQILMSSWETLLKRLKDQPRGVAVTTTVRVDITQSCPWPKVIAGASEKSRPQLVGDGIKECFLEISERWKNARTGTAQPLVVLTHSNGWQVLYHPKKDKEGLLAFRRRDDPHGDLRFDKAEPDKEDRTLAFELAAKFKEKKIAGKIKDFQESHRPDGWGLDDFEIGSNDPNSECKVWAWVLSQKLQRKWLAWLSNPQVNRQDVPEASEHRAWGQAAEHHEDEIQVDLEEGDEDGVLILNAITTTMRSEHLSSLDEVLDYIKLKYAGQNAMRVKEEKKVAVVPVKMLRFTQKSCAPTFRGGKYKHRPLQDFIDGLKAGEDNPIKDDWITLDVVKHVSTGNLWSLDNRRLYCLKKFQEHLDCLDPSGTGKPVEVAVNIYEWVPAHDKLLDHCDTRNEGMDITVRDGQYKRRRLH